MGENYSGTPNETLKPKTNVLINIVKKTKNSK